MTTGPEDPLARMARWNALRQRLADHSTEERPPPSSPVPILAELAEAARRLVEQQPAAAVSITVHTPAGALSAQVSWADGHASITVPTPAANAGAAAHAPAPAPAPAPAHAPAPAASPPPHPVYGQPPGAAQHAADGYRPERGYPPTHSYPQAGGYPPLDNQPPVDHHSPAAAQLAEILRQDPSLLTHRVQPDPQSPA